MAEAQQGDTAKVHYTGRLSALGTSDGRGPREFTIDGLPESFSWLFADSYLMPQSERS